MRKKSIKRIPFYNWLYIQYLLYISLTNWASFQFNSIFDAQRKTLKGRQRGFRCRYYYCYHQTSEFIQRVRLNSSSHWKHEIQEMNNWDTKYIHSNLVFLWSDNTSWQTNSHEKDSKVFEIIDNDSGCSFEKHRMKRVTHVTCLVPYRCALFLHTLVAKILAIKCSYEETSRFRFFTAQLNIAQMFTSQ